MRAVKCDFIVNCMMSCAVSCDVTKMLREIMTCDLSRVCDIIYEIMLYDLYDFVLVNDIFMTALWISCAVISL